jgi:hypothetical protein
MVNSNSTTFKFSEKVGLFIGRGIRYVIMGGIIIFLGGKLGTPNPAPNPPAR